MTSPQRNSEAELLSYYQELLSRQEAALSLQKFIEYLGICPSSSSPSSAADREAGDDRSGELKRLMVWMPPGICEEHVRFCAISALTTWAITRLPVYWVYRILPN